MGIYLPLSSSTPLFIGSLFAFIIKFFLKRKQQRGAASDLNFQQHNAVLLSCGLVAGAALMDVLLAIPLSITGNTRLLAILPLNWHSLATLLGFLSLLIVAACFYWAIQLQNKTSKPL